MGVGWKERKKLLHDFLPQWLPSKIWSRDVINCISEVIRTQASLEYFMCVVLKRLDDMHGNQWTTLLHTYMHKFLHCVYLQYFCMPASLLALHLVVIQRTWNDTSAILCTKLQTCSVSLRAYLVSPVVTWTHINFMNSTKQWSDEQCITGWCVFKKKRKGSTHRSHTDLKENKVKIRTGIP